MGSNTAKLIICFCVFCLLLNSLGGADVVEAQCTYEFEYDFTGDVPNDWVEANWFYVPGEGHDGLGAMGTLSRQGQNTTNFFTKGEILESLGIDPDNNILANGVTFETWVRTNYIRGSIYNYINFTNGQRIFAAATSVEWTKLSLTVDDDTGLLLSKFAVQYIVTASWWQSAYFDDFRVIIPCDNIFEPEEPTSTPTPTTPTATPTLTPTPTNTPTPTYTPTLLPGQVTPIPSPTPYIAPRPGGGGIPLPEPFPIPTIDPANTIDLSVFWDIEGIGLAISTIRTLPALINQFNLMYVLAFLSAVILTVKWLSNFVGKRDDSV